MEQLQEWFLIGLYYSAYFVAALFLYDIVCTFIKRRNADCLQDASSLELRMVIDFIVILNCGLVILLKHLALWQQLPI